MDKLLKAFAVGIVAFSAILAIFVGARVDQFTMSMLGGAFLGLLIAVPTTLVATLIVTRADARQPERAMRYSVPMPQSPPPYWTIPNQPVAQQPTQSHYAMPRLTNNNHAWPGAQPESPFQRRKFFVIGESGVMEELRANGGESEEEDTDEPFRIVNPHLLGAAR